MIGQPYLNFDI